MKNFYIIGLGAWGLTLAKILLENGRSVIAFIRDAEKISKYTSGYKGVSLPPNLRYSTSISDVSTSDCVVIAVPSFAFRDAVRLIKNYSTIRNILIATKGFSPENKLMSEILVEEILGASFAVISGPNLSREINDRKPASSIIASKNMDLARKLQEAFSNDYFRIYISEDVIGVQIAGALKNVYAIGAGIIDALELGMNAKAAYLARSIAEMYKFGKVFNANPYTFMGLAGIGDLIATAFSSLSRNYTVGFLLGKKNKLADILKNLSDNNMVAEGVNATLIASQIALKYNIDMPLLFAIKMILEGEQNISNIILSLLRRPLREEFAF